jgi:protoheme IX farnesyltransferase
MSRLDAPRAVTQVVDRQPSALERTARALAARLADYLELTKPRIVVLELIVAGAAACLASRHDVNVAVVLHALGATALVAGSASIGNQVIERRSDARMRRTANRPLPAGRITTFEAVAMSAAALAIGVWCLAAKFNLATAALGVASWVIYVLIYTPLKRRSPVNTTVGAVAGAIPILMGWTATGTPLNLTALALAGLLFLWQFPHFMAIAWLYRHDYASGGHRMLTVVDPSGIYAGVQAVSGAAMLIPVSLIPALNPTSGSPMVYATWVTLMGAGQLALAIRFALQRDERSARLLLRATLLYLPACMGLLLMVSM